MAVVCAAGNCDHRCCGDGFVARVGPMGRWADGRCNMIEQPISPSADPAVLLGIDSGGSHTAVAVGDRQGRVLSRAEGPGSAMRPGGAERSAAVIFDVARRAATQAKVSLPAVFAVVGAAGAGATPEQDALAAALTDAGVATRVNVRTDVEIALAAAFGDGPGMLINAGTG